jgi:hypothetical protein
LERDVSKLHRHLLHRHHGHPVGHQHLTSAHPAHRSRSSRVRLVSRLLASGLLRGLIS